MDATGFLNGLMGMFGNDIVGNGQHAHQHNENNGQHPHWFPPQQHQQRPSGKAPPASKSAIDTLPMVKVTADDLLEAANKECTVCLDEQKLGAYAVKLQCGHLFHRDCLVEWLKCQCTCPVCRFEIETDDANYERERKNRMKKRKLRFRLDEINKKSISQLKELAKNLQVDITGCLDKTEVIDRLVKSGHIDITAAIPPLEVTQDELSGKSVSELKHLLLSYGISVPKGAIEKQELRNLLLESGRVVLVDTPEEEVRQAHSTDSYGDSYGNTSGNSNSGISNSGVGSYGDSNNDSRSVNNSHSYNDSNSSYNNSSNNSPNKYNPHEKEEKPFYADNTHSSSYSNSNSPTRQNNSNHSYNNNNSSNGNDNSDSKSSSHHKAPNSPKNHSTGTAGVETYTLGDLNSSSLSELKDICRRHKIDISKCLYKSEIVDSIVECSTVIITSDIDYDININADIDDVSNNNSSSGSNYHNNTGSNANFSDVRDNGCGNSSISNSYSDCKHEDNKVNVDSDRHNNSNSSNNNSNNNSESKSESKLSDSYCDNYNTRAESKNHPISHWVENEESDCEDYITSGSASITGSNNCGQRTDRSGLETTGKLSSSINNHADSKAYHTSTSDSSAYKQPYGAKGSSNSSYNISNNNYNNNRADDTHMRDTIDNDTSIFLPDSPVHATTGNSKVAEEDKFLLTRELLDDMSIAELRSIMESYGIEGTGYLDREDIITKLSEHDALHILD